MIGGGVRRALDRAARIVLLAAAVGGGPGCAVGYPAGYGGDYYDYPPDAYIATTEPIYFEGRATYFYGGRWYYRDGGRWSHYDREPPGLYQRRMQAPPVRRSFERYSARPAPRAPGRPGSWRGTPGR
ncbi:MAG TPA: hypothetical protein VMU50_00160 [Polyangia bacterium]|nr:hypothetical protein [Polyangia bacterium]